MAVSIRQTPEVVKKFIHDFGVTCPVALDPTGKMGRPFNIQAVPTHFILDRGRVVRFEGHGITADEIVSKVNGLLAGRRR